MNFFQQLFCIFAVSSVSAFCPPAAPTRGCHIISLNLVTEADVIALVEKAEDLWGQVERLRKEADDFSVQAEFLGQEAESSSSDAMKLLQSSISEEKLKEANDAQNLTLDAGALLEKALMATTQGDKIEALADEALLASEKALEQHLIDFPEDDEIDTL